MRMKQKNMMLYKPATAALLVYGLIHSSVVMSAEYVVGADFSPTLLYNDNVLLRENERSSFFTRLSPTLSLSRAEANSKIMLSAGYRIERYASLSELDREDPFANLSLAYNTERSVYGLTAGYSQNAQRDIAFDDTGDFSSNATVTTRTISPNYQYQLTEKDFVYTNLNYQERTYGNTGSGLNNQNFSDNESISLTGGWRRNLSERLTGGVAVTYVMYESESPTQKSDYDSYNISLTSTYRITEKWSVDGSVGYRTLDSENRFIDGSKRTDKSTGTLFNIALRYAGETDTLALTISRALNPSGEGVVNEVDSVGLGWSRQMTELLSANLNTSYQQTESADDFNRTQRKFFTLSPSLRWQMNRQFAFDLGYQYRRQEGDNSAFNNSNDSKIDSNMFYLTLDYNWDGKRFSR